MLRARRLPRIGRGLPHGNSALLKQLVLGAREKQSALLLKGGDPAARSRTATLLRLHPSH